LEAAENAPHPADVGEPVVLDMPVRDRQGSPRGAGHGNRSGVGLQRPSNGVPRTLLNIVLPAGNIFDDQPGTQPAGTQGLSVGHGWVTLLHPLTPGTHTIVIVGAVVPDPVTTRILVQPGR
jgi:hypothetical protein